MRPILLNSCVLIDYLRDRPEAVAYLERLDRKPLISALTVAELYAGVREGRERTVSDVDVPTLSPIRPPGVPALTPFAAWDGAIALTDFGRRLLDGGADWMAATGIDWWVGYI